MSSYCVEIPYLVDATKYFVALADLPWAAWLDSGGMSRYDIITASPYKTLEVKQADKHADPYEMVRQELGEKIAPIENIPFAGGALGYWAYDLAQRKTHSADSTLSAHGMPLMSVGIYDWALVIDHQCKKASLVSHLKCTDTGHLLKQILVRLKEEHKSNFSAFRVHGKIKSNFTEISYGEAFSKVKDYLRAGDCYQINLAQRFHVAASGDAFEAYLKLRKLSPAPFSAFLNLPHSQVLCSSPERFIRIHNGEVETRPIKGTRPRNTNEVEDSKTVLELQNSPKDRAENLMIVDLLRNDLGKNCEPGSISVPRLFEIESYKTVHHMVSTVTGKIAAGRDALNVLGDCFPGGSVTGAPKQRAMQIIEQLEPDRRGVYCGAIGYIGFDGNMDSNIAIRTMIHSNNEVCCWAGGGIVADSDESSEYQETFDKALSMLETLRLFGG